MSALRTLLPVFSICISTLQSWAAEIDTLSGKDRAAIAEAQKNSFFEYVSQMRNFSLRRDSVRASEYLLKISPYYFLKEWESSTRPDTFLKKLNLTVVAREQYILLYHKALSDKSDTYKAFEQMGQEDQKVRYMLERCGDTTACRKINRRMRVSDSTHFAQLYEYVQKNGWPTLEDGSLYATLIAIHDHARHAYYMPYLKTAALKGHTNLAAVELVNYYLSRYFSYEEILTLMHTHKYLQFDISSMLRQSLPSSLPRIQKAFKAGCGSNFKHYYFFEAPNNKIFSDWANSRPHNHENDIFTLLQKELQPFCSKKNNHPTVWGVDWVPAPQVKLKMVIIYLDQKQ